MKLLVMCHGLVSLLALINMARLVLAGSRRFKARREISKAQFLLTLTYGLLLCLFPLVNLSLALVTEKAFMARMAADEDLTAVEEAQ